MDGLKGALADSQGKGQGKNGNKKKKDIYLENVVDKSRNDKANVLRPEKRNFTIGKLQKRDHQTSQVNSVDRILIESL